MCLDVLAGLRLGVCAQPVPHPVRHACKRTPLLDIVDFIEICRKNFQCFGKVRRCPLAGHVGFGKTDIAPRKHAPHHGVVMDFHHRVGARLIALKAQAAAIGQNHGKGTRAELEQKGQPGLEQPRHASQPRNGVAARLQSSGCVETGEGCIGHGGVPPG